MLWKSEQIIFYSAPGLGYTTWLASDLMSGWDLDVRRSSHPPRFSPKEQRLSGREGGSPGEPDASPAASSLEAGLEGSLQSAPAPQLRARIAPEV